jgi:hypothetical protein
MMQSIEGHQVITKGEAAATPVGGPRERRRVQNLAAKLRQKLMERTLGYSGSRRKLATACRNISRRAKVAWRKEIWSGIFGPWKSVDGKKSSPPPE